MKRQHREERQQEPRQADQQEAVARLELASCAPHHAARCRDAARVRRRGVTAIENA